MSKFRLQRSQKFTNFTKKCNRTKPGTNPGESKMLLQKCHPGPVDLPCFLSCPEFVWSSAMEKMKFKSMPLFPSSVCNLGVSLQAFGEEFCSHWAKIDYFFAISDFNHGPKGRASLIGFVPASAWTQQFRSRSATTLPLWALHVMYVPRQPFTTWVPIVPIGLGNCIYWSGTCTCAISEFTNSRSMPRS